MAQAQALASAKLNYLFALLDAINIAFTSNFFFLNLFWYFYPSLSALFSTFYFHLNTLNFCIATYVIATICLLIW